MVYKVNSCDYDIKNFIRNIIVNEFRIDYWNEWLDEQNYDILQVIPNVLFSVDDHHKLIGICSVKRIDDDVCYLNTFYVDKEFRNKGIGTNLFHMSMDYAKNHGYKRVILCVDPSFKDAISIYEKNHFVFDYYNDERKEIWYYRDI